MHISRENKIRVFSLHGSKAEMGFAYGKVMLQEMQESLIILKDFYIIERGISYKEILAIADLFYNKYPTDYQLFLQEISKGSGMSLDDVKILNGMETLYYLVLGKQTLSACTFMAIPPAKSATGSVIIGRNYDFPEPYNKITKHLTVTILNETGKIPTAIISLPGQIYCPTGINKKGLFIEFNNGGPSGGYEVVQFKKSMLIQLLEMLQTSHDLAQLNMQMLAADSDYSLIVNAASATEVRSMEYSATKGKMPYAPAIGSAFISTNIYQNEAWKLPEIAESDSWNSCSRQNNLSQLTNRDDLSIENVMDIMDLDIEQGGAKWTNTIYQIICHPATNDLYIKRNGVDKNWHNINLKNYWHY